MPQSILTESRDAPLFQDGVTVVETSIRFYLFLCFFLVLYLELQKFSFKLYSFWWCPQCFVLECWLSSFSKLAARTASHLYNMKAQKVFQIIESCIHVYFSGAVKCKKSCCQASSSKIWYVLHHFYNLSEHKPSKISRISFSSFALATSSGSKPKIKCTLFNPHQITAYLIT